MSINKWNRLTEVQKELYLMIRKIKLDMLNRRYLKNE